MMFLCLISWRHAVFESYLLALFSFKGIVTFIQEPLVQGLTLSLNTYFVQYSCLVTVLFPCARCSISQSGHIQQANFANMPNEKNKSTIQWRKWTGTCGTFVFLVPPAQPPVSTHTKRLYTVVFSVSLKSVMLHLVNCISSSYLLIF